MIRSGRRLFCGEDSNLELKVYQRVLHIGIIYIDRAYLHVCCLWARSLQLEGTVPTGDA